MAAAPAKPNPSANFMSQSYTQTGIQHYNNLIATAASTTSVVMYQNAVTGQGATFVPEHDQVGFCTSEATDKDGEFRDHLVHVRCPHCAHPNYPFRRKKKPVCLESGEEWQGIEYKQPYANYQTVCCYCDEVYYLKIFAD